MVEVIEVERSVFTVVLRYYSLTNEFLVGQSAFYKKHWQNLVHTMQCRSWSPFR
jgi:hypothetical protein